MNSLVIFQLKFSTPTFRLHAPSAKTILPKLEGKEVSKKSRKKRKKDNLSNPK